MKRTRARSSLLVLFLATTALLLPVSSFSQVWTWQGGSDQPGSPGVHGTMGVAAPWTSPGGRVNSATWKDASGNLWIFGGYGVDANGSQGWLNDLWKYDKSSGQWTWMHGDSVKNANSTVGVLGVADPANNPGGRHTSACWSDADGNFWLFGGFGFAANSSGDMCDVWKYTVSTDQWTWMGGNADAYGFANYGTQSVPDVANSPGAREFPTAWLGDSNTVWIFGGYGFPAPGVWGYLSDLWKYNMTTGEWTWVSGGPATNESSVFGTQGVADPANKPAGRGYVCHWKDHEGNLWMFGGRQITYIDGDGWLSDLWKYDVSAGLWTWVSGGQGIDERGVYGTKYQADPANRPGGRESAIGWEDTSGNTWIFGGAGFGSSWISVQNDIWKYEKSTGLWTWMGGPENGDGQSSFGTPGLEAAGNQPGGREENNAGWEDGNGNMWIFGGSGYASGNGGHLSDLWSVRVSNKAPFFTEGASASLTVCGNGAPENIEAQIRVNDLDPGQTITWTVLSAPVHGTISGLGATAASGSDTLTLSGAAYAANVGYSGPDAFLVSVSDGKASDTIQFNVTVNPAPAVGPISGADTLTAGSAISLSDATPGGDWTSSDDNIATVDASGNVTGVSGGIVTISYSLTQGGCTGFATHPVTVKQPGGALAFDGVDDYVEVPGSAALDFTSGTIEMWVKPKASNDASALLAMRTSTDTRWSLHLNEGYDYIGIWNGSYFDAIGFNIDPDTWYHIAVIMGSSYNQVYVNGVFAGYIGAPLNNSLTGYPLIMGAPFAGASAEVFNGSIEEVRIWDRELCGNEIQNSMNCEMTLPQTGLVAYYKFNQGMSGQDNTGTDALTDEGSNTLTGSLNNFALAGSSSNWSAGHVSGTCAPFTLPTPTVAIQPVNLCPGYPTTFTAVATDAGSYPYFQWTDDGNPVGYGYDTYFDYAVQPGHVIQCQVYPSGDVCTAVPSATSNTLTVPSTPVTQATDLSVLSVSSTQIKINFKRGSGNGGVLVVVSKDYPLYTDPECGVSYNAPTTNAVNFSDPGLTDLDYGKVVYKNTTNVIGTSLNLNLNNLTTGQYYFYVYEYDNSANGPVYLKPAAEVSAAILLPQPSVNLTNVTITNILSDRATISWTNGNGTGRMVVITPDDADLPVPQNNYFYYPYNSWGQGENMLGQSYVVFAGSGNSVTVDNLSPLVKYSVWLAEYNDDGINIRYRTQVKKTFRTTAGHYSLTQTGTEIVQNFEDLSTAADAEIAPGKWQFAESGSNSDFFYQPSDGNISGPGVYSFGTDGDRAFGSVTGSGSTADIGIRIKNTSDDTITSVLVSYTGEQWYRGAVPGNEDELRFSYSTITNSLTGSNFIREPELDFRSPVTTGSGPMDGNAPANRTRISNSITGLSIPPGENIWLKFADLNLTSGNDGLAIDDFSFIAFTTTIVGGGDITATKLNDLNIVGGTATSQVNCLTIKKAVNMEQGGKLDISGNATTKHNVKLTGQIYGDGTISSNEYSGITLGGSAVGQILALTPGSRLRCLTLASGAAASLGTDVRISANPKGQVKVGGANPATLNTNDHLILESDSVSSGSVAAVNGSITGNVTVERSMQYRDALRLIAHPFSAAITPAQLTDDIAVNVAPGSENLWWYDPATAVPGSISGLAASSSWTPVGSLAFGWQPYQAIRVSKAAGQATLDMDGPLNQGDISVPLNWGADSFLVVGNPYASTLKPANAITMAAGAGVINDAAIYTWNPTLGANGAFVTVPNASLANFKLPANGVFIAITGGTTGSLLFTEADKAPAIATMNYFRPDGEEEEVEVPAEPDQPVSYPEGLKLTIMQKGQYQDAAYIYFSERSDSRKEKTDAPKISNPGMDLYARSSEGYRLALDQRPFQPGERIPLGLEKANGDYTISISDWNLPAGAKLYLEDHAAGSEVELNANSVYKFSADDRSAGRFFLRMGGSTAATAVLSLELAPNPATDMVTLRLNAPGEGRASVRILNVTGQQMLAAQMPSTQHSQLTLPLQGLAAGVYLVEVTVGTEKISRQLLKQ